MHFQPGNLVNARDRVWVVQSDSTDDWLFLRPLDGADDEITKLIPALEAKPIELATFAQPDPSDVGSFALAPLFYNALRFQLRSSSGPFRSFGSINFEPRSYQFVPLLMAMRQETVRLLIADDVGVGKTIESGLIIRELIDRGEVQRFAVLCPPSLVEQWCEELLYHFNLKTTALTASNAQAIERSIPHGHNITEYYPYIVVSLDYIKSDLHRDYFEQTPLDLILVDEAHTCVRALNTPYAYGNNANANANGSISAYGNSNGSGNGSGSVKGNKQKRFDLLQKITSDPQRHVLLLTATPHSGNEEAFFNLLSLLDMRFLQLKTDTSARSPLRAELAKHFIQRRRKDIKEWKEQAAERITGFPRRMTTEVKYQLNDDWRKFLDRLQDYCIDFILHCEKHHALTLKSTAIYEIIALLRCAASSPDAATTTLKNRLAKVNKAQMQAQNGSAAPAPANDSAHASDGDGDLFGMQQLEAEMAEDNADAIANATETEIASEPDSEPDSESEADDFDYSAKAMVAQDLSDDITIELSDQAPSLELSDSHQLKQLVTLSQQLSGLDKDPKLATVVVLVKELVEQGFHPVLFCRFVETAKYVTKYLQQVLVPETSEQASGNGSGSGKKTKVAKAAKSATGAKAKSKAKTNDADLAIKNDSDSALATAIAGAGKIADLQIACVTGEYVPEERKAKVDELMQSPKRILVATDCLSEGINLQQGFTAVVHYDLAWNPNRHEQREGRVDRFGQSEKEVRCATLYSEDNPIDQLIMAVIRKKSEKIQKELGVYVAVPDQSEFIEKSIILDNLMKRKEARSSSFLRLLEQDEMLQNPANPTAAQTNATGAGAIGAAGADGATDATSAMVAQNSRAQLLAQKLDTKWQDFLQNASKTRTIFAHSNISPDDIKPYWEQQQNFLGSFHDVWDFLTQGYALFDCQLKTKENNANHGSATSVLRLKWQSNDGDGGDGNEGSENGDGGNDGNKDVSTAAAAAAANKAKETAMAATKPQQPPFTKFLFPVEQISTEGDSLKQSLYDEGFKDRQVLDIEQVHRAAPIVSLLASNLIDRLLSGTDSRLKRCGLAMSDQVEKVTSIYLLRLRYQMHLLERKKNAIPRQIMVEEIMPLMAQGRNQVTWEHSEQVVKLLFNSHSEGNFEQAVAQRQISNALELINRPESQQQLEQLAQERAQTLENEHNALRTYSTDNHNTQVQPCLPVDVLGVYVLLPKTV